MVFGAPKSLKTFVMLDLVCSAAAGVKRHPELPPLRHEELPPPSGS